MTATTTSILDNVSPRPKDKKADPAAHQNISLDAQQQYLLTIPTNTTLQNVVLYDGAEKIAELIVDHLNRVNIKSFSTKQITIDSTIQAQSVNIDAPGKVILKKPVISNYLTIQAHSLELTQPIIAVSGANFEIKENITASQEIHSGFLNISANNIQLKNKVVAQETATFNAKEKIVSDELMFSKEKITLQAQAVNLNQNLSAPKLSIKAKTFICDENSKIEVKQLKIDTKECALYGNVKAISDSKINSERLDTANTLILAGTTQLTVSNWNCYKGSKVYVQHADANKQSHIKIQEKFLGETGSEFNLYATENLQKSIKFDNPESLPIHLNTKRLKTNGVLNIFSTKYEGNNWVVDKNAKAQLNQSCLQLGNIIIDGSVTGQNSQLTASESFFHGSTSVTTYQNVAITNSDNITTQGKHVFNQVQITDAKKVDLLGDLTFAGLAIKGDDITFCADSTESLAVTEINAKQLLLASSKNNQCNYKGFQAQTSVFETSGNIELTDSKIHMTGNSVSRNHGILTVNNTILKSEGQYYNGPNAKLSVVGQETTAKNPSNNAQFSPPQTAPSPAEKKSTELTPGLYADRIFNQGDIKLNQTQSVISSIIHVGKNFEAINAQISLTKNLFMDGQAQLNFKNTALIAENDKPRSHAVVTGQSQIILDENSRVELKNLFTLSNTLLTLQNAAKLDVSETAQLLGVAKAKNSQFSFNQLNLLGDLTIHDSIFQTQNTDLFGKLNLEKMFADMGQKVLTRPNSELSLTDSRIKTEKMRHQGHLNSKSLTKDDQAEKNTTPAKATKFDKEMATLNCEKKLKTYYGSKITGDNITLATNEWLNAGDIALTGRLLARGQHLLNEGSISAGTSIDFGFNGLFNYGALSSKNMQLKSGVFANLGGRISANSLENTSFLNINLGLISAYQQQTNSLLSINMGLSIPNLPSKDQLFSWDTARRGIKTAVCTLLPDFSSPINLGYALYSGGSSVHSIYQHRDEFKSIYKLPLYEVADKTCQLTNIGVAGFGVWTQGKNIWGKLQQHASNYVEHLNKTDLRSATYNEQGELIAKSDWSKVPLTEKIKMDLNLRQDSVFAALQNGYSNITKIDADTMWRWTHYPNWETAKKLGTQIGTEHLSKIGRSAWATIAPSYNSQGLADFSYGTVFSGNISEMNVYSHTGFSKIALDSITINSLYLNNYGAVNALFGSTNLYGITFNNHGSVAGMQGVSAKYNTINLMHDSQHEYRHWQFETDVLNTYGSHLFDESKIIAKEFNANAHSNNSENIDSINFSKSSLVTNTYNLNVNTTADESYLQADTLNQSENLSVQNKSEIKITEEQTIAKDKTFKVSDHSSAKIKNQKFNKASEVIIENHSIHEVEKKWEIPEGARAIAKGTTKQAQETQQLLAKTEELQQQHESELATLKQNKAKQEHVNKCKQHEIDDLQDKIKQLDTPVSKNANKISQNSSSHKKSSVKKSEKLTIQQQRTKLQEDLNQKQQEFSKIQVTQQESNQAQELKITALNNSLTENRKALGQVNSQFKAPGLDLSGELNVKDGSQLVLTEDGIINPTGAMRFENNASGFGKSLHSHGKTKFYHAYVDMENSLSFSNNAQNTLHTTHIKTKQVDDKSKTLYSGYSGYDVNEFQHAGNTELDPENSKYNLFYLNAETANLGGHGTFDRASFNIKKLVNPAKFVLGEGSYNNYQFHQMLQFVTPEKLAFVGNKFRDCDLSLTAASIFFNDEYKINHSLDLKSTEGNIVFKNHVSAINIHADSAGHILNHHASVNAQEQLTLLAKLNIENRSGIYRGGDYAKLVAGKDILNLCHETIQNGKYDIIKNYEPGIIIGGAGNNSDGMGIYLKAGGRVLNDASLITGVGSNYVEGDKGVEFKTRTHTYLNLKHHHEGFLGFNETHVRETATQVCNSLLNSENGQNVVRSGSGNVEAVATNFCSAQGSQIYADQYVRLFSIKTDSQRYESSSSWWGLSEHERHEHHQEVIPTVVIDHGSTTIQAKKGDVNARGSLFLGDGDLHIQAGKNINLSRDILNHSVKEKSHSVGVSFFGVNAFNVFKQGGSVWQALASEDATLQKLHALGQSATLPNLAANSWNFAIDAFNTTNNFMHGINDNNLTGTFLQRYGLGNAQGINPTINFNFNWSESQSRYQTTGPGGIDRKGILTLDAGEKISLNDGFSIHAFAASVKAEELEMNAAKLSANARQKSTNFRVGVSTTGNIANVGAGHSEAKFQGERYENAQLNVDNHLDVNLNKASLNGANINTGSISGDINQLNINSQQDKVSSSSWSVDANTSGMCSASVSKQESIKTNNPSGIHVNQSINELDQKSFSVNELNTKGGKITSDNKINEFAKETTASNLNDHEQGFGIGLSMNVNELNRLNPNHAMHKPSKNRPSQPAIATMSVGVNYVNNKSQQRSTIYGKNGTKINAANGPVNTNNASGYYEQRNDKLQVQVDVPITNSEYLKAAKQNITSGMHSFFGAQPKLQTDQPIKKTKNQMKNNNKSLNTKNKPKENQQFIKKPTTLSHAAEIKNNNNSDEYKKLEAESDENLSKNNEKQDNVENSKNNKSKKLFRPDMKAKPHVVRVSQKPGAQGKPQSYGIKDGNFTSEERNTEEIKKLNEKNRLIKQAKISFKKDLMSPMDIILLQYGDEEKIIRPTALVSGRAFFACEVDILKNQFSLKFESDWELRFNLAQGKVDTALGTLTFALDTASACSLFRLSATNERGMNLEAHLEGGFMGPTIGANFKTLEISLFGLSMQGEVSGAAGIGVKSSIGAGATLDKTKPGLRMYTSAGGYAGFGAEGKVQLNLGLDPEFSKKMTEEGQRIANEPMFKTTIDKIRECREAAEKRQPDTWLGKLWQVWEIACFDEAENDWHENVGNKVTGAILAKGGFFGIRSKDSGQSTIQPSTPPIVTNTSLSQNG